MKRSNVGKIIEKIFNLKMFAVLVVIAFLSAGYIYTFKIKGTTYEAKTTLLISRNGLEENNNRNFEEIISTYVEMTRSNSVLSDAMQRLNLENYDMENIIIERKNDSDLIEISVIDRDEERAKKISKEISNIIFEKNETQLKLASIEVIDDAENNCNPVYSSQATDMIAFAVMGCFVSIVSCQLIKTFDNKVKSKKDIESIEVKELIELPKIDKKIVNSIIKLEDKSMFSEAFKIMRTNIQFINFKSKQKVIMVTESNVRKDLKSFIISNLAVGYANTGKKVMLIDSDIRNGNIAKIFNITQDFGLANYLSNVDLDGLDINENNIGKYIKNTSFKKLDVITAGYIAPNPSELIATNKFKETLKVLEKVYDVILVNIATEDINVMSQYIKGCILVTEHNKMNKSLMTKIRNQFELKEGKMIGVVLASVPMYKLKYFNKYSIYFKSEEEDLMSKKNIEAIEAKEQKEKERLAKLEEKKFKEEVKKVEKEKAIEVKQKKKEEKAALKQEKQLNEESFIFKVYNIINKLSDFFGNIFRKFKTRNKRLAEKFEQTDSIISNSVAREEERFTTDEEALETVIKSHVQKDAIIQNLEKELEAMHEDYIEEEIEEKYFEELSKEYDNISKEYKEEVDTEKIEPEEIKSEIKEKKEIFKNLKVNFFKVLEKMSMVEKVDEEKIVDTDYKEKVEEDEEEIAEETSKELTYEEKYMNNYNELYSSEYSYSSTTSFADFERGTASKIDKSEQDLLEQNERLDLDTDTIKVNVAKVEESKEEKEIKENVFTNILSKIKFGKKAKSEQITSFAETDSKETFSKNENATNSNGLKFETKIEEQKEEKVDEKAIDFEEVMKQQAIEEEKILNEDKDDLEKFKKEQKEKKKKEKLEKKKLKKLEKESKIKLNNLNYGDKKEIDQEEEYLMDNLYPKFK